LSNGYKQVIVVRTDIKMGKGKTCAQVAHASLGAALEAMRRKPTWFEEWQKRGQKKVVLKVGSEKELYEIYEKAKTLGLPTFLVKDAGLTQLEPGTTTAVAVGPAPEEEVDKITGKLKLL